MRLSTVRFLAPVGFTVLSLFLDWATIAPVFGGKLRHLEVDKGLNSIVLRI